MSSPEQDPQDQQTAADKDDDDSIVSPPAYPAYSTPPPEGLAVNEDG